MRASTAGEAVCLTSMEIFQRPARVLHRHASSKTLRGSQRYPTYMMRIQLGQHFDDDLPFRPRAQHRENRRQMRIETYVHHAAAH